MQAYQKYYDAIRQYKWGFLVVLLNRLLPDHFTYHHLLIYGYPLQKEKSVPFLNSSVHIEKTSDLESDLFEQFHQTFPSPDFVSRIQEPGTTLYVAKKKEEVVAYAWVKEQDLYLEEINHDYPLDSDEIFLYACYVSREHRGEGIHTLLLQERLRDYRRDPRYHNAYVGVLSINKGSIKGIEKAGFREISRIRYLNLFGKEWWFFGKLTEQLHERFREQLEGLKGHLPTGS